MKIAVVGSGISGLGAALALSEKHEVWLFEKNSYFGGHSNTVKIELKEEDIHSSVEFKNTLGDILVEILDEQLEAGNLEYND